MREKDKYLFSQLEARERQEEILWKKKSQVKWLREGEKNTKLFHKSVPRNRLGSKIFKLKKSNGTQVETREEIEEELTNHFKEIMTEDNIDRG